MAKICPITKEKVLYLDCLECENRLKCKNLQKRKSETANIQKKI